MVSPTSTSTPFPNLSSTVVSIESNSSTTNTSFQLPQDASRDTILLSWAHLLRGYTSSDAVSFSVDSETVVEVDFSTNAVTEQTVSEESSERGTALYFLKDSPRDAKAYLSIHPDLDAGMAYLWATSFVVPKKQLENIAAQLAHILSSSPTNPDSKISFPEDGPELSILNPHPQKLEGPELLHELIPTSCPEALALDFLNADGSRTQLSYAELHAVSDKLAAQICRALAATEGKTRNIPIFLPQSPELYVAQFAILKAGGAFVPLNLDAPQERVKFVAAQVGAGAVLTNSDFISTFSWEGAPEIITFEASDLSSLLAAEEAEEFESSSIEPTDAAYIMFTSGSTGAPKGVTISHTAAAQSFLSHNPHIPPFSRFLQFAAPTFDVSVFDTFFPLYRSSTLVGCARSILLSDLPGTINRLEVDAIELTPTVANELLGPRNKVPGLKYLLTIGEMLTQGLVNEWAGGALQGMYGPTEAAIHCTLAPDFPRHSKVGNIGIPLSTVSCFVVSAAPAEDGGVEVLPAGWVGELAVGGHQLADGYLNRPDLTSGAFIETAQYGRLYRTGDRARILVDGTMECLGRVSSGQVKLRGQRVELGEIEAIILKTPGIKAAVASVVEGSLVAYVSTTTGVEVAMDEVKETCKLWLPGFMVPGDVVFFSDLPRLASGKADRKRLDADYIAASASRTSSVEEQLTETEAAVAGCVEELLGRKPAKDASLVAQGLDSLQAIRLVCKLRSRGLQVEVIDIVKSDSISGISSSISSSFPASSSAASSDAATARFAAVHAAGYEKLPEEVKALVQDVIPCTSLQEAMIAETARDEKAYCNFISVSLPSEASVSSIQQSVKELISANEILRTGFIALEGGFAQVVYASASSSQFAVVDALDQEWSLTFDQLLDAPFRVVLLVEEEKKTLGFYIHHALYDGWSFENLLSDLQLLLRGSQLPPRPQYRNVVRHELSRPTSALEASTDFWGETLSGAGSTRLPSFHGRHDIPPGVGVKGSSLATSRHQLELAAKQQGVSNQVLVQAAWAYLLSSYAGKDDIVFGTVSSGRTVAVEGIESISGPTILTLPVRVKNVGLTTIAGDVLKSCHEFNRGLLEHSIGLREIRKRCGEEGVFDTLIVWQQTANERAAGGLEILESKDKLEFSLLLEVEPVGDEIKIRVTYKEEVLPAKQVDSLLAQLSHLISAITANPQGSFKQLLADAPAEVLSIANPFPELIPQPSTRTLATCFEDSAAAYPDHVALEMTLDIRHGQAETIPLTYTQLNCASNQLAGALVSRGVKPDDLVAVFMEKSLFCYVAILATVKAGAGYLPLQHETPTERARAILVAAGVKILLATPDLIERLGEIEGVEMINIFSLDLSEFPDENLGIQASSEGLAYAVFTSGSTGVPKGVLVEHEQAVGMLDILAEMYPTAPGKRLLQFCNIAFDVSVFEIFFAWHRGMVLSSATKDVLLRNMEEAVNAMHVTHLSMTPTVAALMRPENVPRVEFLVTSGEAVTKKVFNDWAGHGLWQGYGPSETTNICTVNPTVEAAHDISNIGPPFANTSAFVVAADEEELVLLPAGSVGELCFGGVQVCRGYLNMPELTARKFMTHPVYGRIYRSGDMGRILPNDDIIFQGRQDDQVKIRGQRIELGEINSVLLKDRSVIIDAVTLVINKDNSPQLVSFVVPTEFQKSEFGVVKAKEVRETVNRLFRIVPEFVPAYMVPNSIIAVSDIPMTVQGKTDKRILTSSFLTLDAASFDLFSGGDEAEEDSEEWTETERTVAAIVAKVAHADLDTVGRNTSIFNLGLDSISAIQLSIQLKAAGFQRLDISQIMKNAKISALARLLSEDQQKDVSTSVDSGVAALAEFSTSVKESVLEQLSYPESEIVKILPCTPLQESTLSSKVGADPRTYYNHTIFTLHADPSRLHSAWSKLVESHEILRTCFAVTSHPRHAFAQVVANSHQLAWSSYEVAEEEMKNRIEEHITEVSEGMDITRPPYAFGVFKAEKGTRLVMSFHHSLYDGFAMDLLLENVQKAYNDADITFTLTPFDTYLAYMESVDMEKADDFWKQTLSGLEPPSFPDLTGKSNAARKELSGMTSQRVASSIPLSTITSGCQELSTSLLALGQSAWARLLSVYTGEQDVCFGNIVSGRTIPVDGVEGIIAPCFNTIPLRVTVSSEATTGDIMDKLMDMNNDAMPYQLTPLRRIMGVMKTEGAQLFDTLFILQSAGGEKGESLWEEEEDRGEMDFSGVVELVPNKQKDQLEIVMHFRRNVVLEDKIPILLSQFDAAIKSALENTEGLALDLSSFDASLLSISNQNPTVLEAAAPGLLHTDFETNARDIPDHIALEYLEDNGTITSLTFAELNSRANKLAHHLLSLGITRDEAVPIWIEKSPLYYICILAILKSGAAFTPIDPSLPASRKQFMIQQLQAKKVLAVSSNAAEDLAEMDVVIINPTEVCQSPDANCENPVILDLEPRHLAYRMYTSGSTGLPKAVSLEHRNAVQTFEASRTLIPWKKESRLLQFAATTFDMCYYDIFMALGYGFTLCSASKKHLLGELEATITKLGVTMLDLTPTVAATLIAENLPQVELLYCIGEAMPQKLSNDWAGRCVNSYGPTEAAMCVTIVPVSPSVKSANIGKPFETTSFLITNPAGQLVPVYGAGELCIGGSQVAREYHNNSVLTEARFVFLLGERFYLTGDVVRMLGDGSFEFIGRKDDQVKIRGLRVELDEINTVAKEVEGVRDAVTMVICHSSEAKEQIVTFVGLEGRRQHGGPAPVVQSKEELMEKVKEKARKMLPRYMVPGVLLVVDHVPLSAAGKVDKKALTALFQSQGVETFSKAVAEEEEELNEQETTIRRVFSEISQVPVEQISRASTIYEIGLDSISAAQVAQRLKREGLQVSVVDILERPSIELLSEILASNSEVEVKEKDNFLADFEAKFLPLITAEHSIAAESINGVFPCTAVQEGMLSQFLRSEGGLYFNHSLLSLPAGIDEEKLRAAWEAIFSNLDILRSGFVAVDDDVHGFATVTYKRDHAKLNWTVIRDVADLNTAVEERKSATAAAALNNLQLPPWALTFLTAGNDSYLLFSGHHALYDATTLQILFQDAAVAYAGTEISTRPQFSSVLGDIVKHILDASVVDSDRDFWLKHLEGSSITNVPNLNPVWVTSPTYHVKEARSSWSLAEIEGSCQQRGISLHAAGQAAWARVLSAYTGETAVTLGVVFSGRTGLEDAAGVAFPCLVTLPSLAVLNDKTNIQLAKEIMQGNVKVLKHQHTPLKSIQRWFEHPEESFFDSIFVYQKTDGENVVSEWKVQEEDAKVDYALSLEIEEQGDKLVTRVTAKDSVMPREQTEWLLKQFDAALVDILENPEVSATDMSHIPKELLSISPPLIDEIPGDVTLLHKFVEKHVAICPDKVAFEWVSAIEGDVVTKTTWTYRQLDEEGNKIANFLRSEAVGVTTGRIVAISFEKCPEASFAILGVLKAGAAYVAIDYSAPIDRKSFIVEDSNAAAVLTMDKYVSEMAAAVKVPVVSAESDERIKQGNPADPEVNDITPENLSYCLYTSGTTGTPKGCELTHENAVQAMYAFQRLFSPHWDADSRFLQFASFHFDVSVLEQFWSWSVGVCVTSAPRDLIFQDLAGAIDKMQITHLDLTPSLAALLRPEDVPKLTKGVFITGGEALKQDILDTWGETGAIYNGYGPTEVTIGMTMYPRVPANGKPSNIGPQFDNVGTYVFARGTETPVARGAVGELCASGKLVGKGYLNRPDLTAKSFPVLKEFGEKIYRTGDLVRLLYDGTFDFLGRADDQVKLRGQRLEIGEINQVMKKAAEEVHAVATLVLRHPKQQKDQLVSFVVLESVLESVNQRAKPEVKTDGHLAKLIAKLVAACKAKLPTYMVPTHFLPISHMPLSVNNKIDNKILKAVYSDTSLEILQQLAKREDDTGAWTESEERLRSILSDMTKLQPSEISRSSTIFELGLDSISVVGFTRRLLKAGFTAATASLVMQHPSLSQLSAALTQATAGSDGNGFSQVEATRQQIAAFAAKNSFTALETLGYQAEEVERFLPCTPLQEGMIARFLESEEMVYWNAFPMVITEATDVDRLRKAWMTVMDNTDMLRTCFADTPDGYIQVVLKNAVFQWEEVLMVNEDYQEEIQRRINNVTDKNKKLQRPPVELLCIRTPTRYILSLNIFHALYDGNSLPLILDDVKAAYNNEFNKRPLEFKDVLAHLLSTDHVKAREFWAANIASSSPLQAEKLLSSTPQTEDYSEDLKLDLASGSLDAICKQLQCTPQSIFQAAWASILASCSGPVVTLGLVVSGRSLPIDNIEGVVGPTFNTIPGCFDVAGAASWEELVKRVQRFNSESLPFHNTPLRSIQKWVKKKGLFETLFAYQKGEEEKGELWEIAPGKAVADYALALEVTQNANGEVSMVIVAKAEFDQNVISDILGRVADNVYAILKNPASAPILEAASSSSVEQLDGASDSSVSVSKDDFTWSPTASALKAAIAGLAEVDETEITADSSILELGLDSIEAIKLSSRLRQKKILLSVSLIMRNPTIRKMIAVLSASSTPAAETKLDKIAAFESDFRKKIGQMDNVVAAYPTTPLQEAMIAETLASDYGLYFNHDVMKLENWVDLEKLRDALKEVVEKNDILRTSFASVEDEKRGQTYAQLVHSTAFVNVKTVSVPTEDAVQDVIDSVMENTTRKADLLKEAPVYFTIVTSPESRHLVLSISHALYDGWSIGLLHEDLKLAYNGQLKSRPSQKLLIENIVNTDAEESKRFWSQVLKGAVPSSFTATAVDAEENKTHRSELQSAVSFAAVQDFCKKSGVTAQSLGQTCWLLLLAHQLGETDVMFGSVLSGRDFEEAERIMFPAMNTVPVRAILHGTYEDMVGYVQQSGAAVLKYQHTPLREIQKITGGRRLFDSIFLYQRSTEGYKGEKLYESVGGSSDVEYAVAVEMERSGDSIFWRNACKPGYFSVEQSDELLAKLDNLLAHIITNPSHPAVTNTKDGLLIGNLPFVKSRSNPVLNGVRVDLDDIAATLSKETGVNCAAIVGDDSLVLFVTSGLLDALVAAAKRVLPYWSLPSFVIPIDTIPFLGGRVDREKLNTIFTSLDNKDQFAVAAPGNEWSATESQIRKIITKISGLPEAEIGRTSTIFHLGLDSISAIRLSSDLRKAGFSLTVAEILKEATIERMASVVEAKGSKESEVVIDAAAVLTESLEGLDLKKALEGLPEQDVEAVYPATAGQVYMLDCWESSNRSLFMPTFVFKTPSLPIAQLKKSWEALVQSNPILRTVFRATGNEEKPFVQAVLRNPAVHFTSSSSGETPDMDFLRYIKSRTAGQQAQPATVPMARLAVHYSPTETHLFLTIHHALYDGVSLPILLEALISPVVPTPQFSFADYLALTHTADAKQTEELYTSYLKGARSTMAPATTTSREGLFRPALMPARALTELGRREGVSFQALFMASFARVLGNRSNTRDVVFGIYLANRNLAPSLPTLMAPTLNIVPLRVNTSSGVVAAAKAVQGDLAKLGGLGTATIGLRDTQRWSGVKVEVFFNFLMGGEGAPGRLEEVTVEDETAVAVRAQMPVMRQQQGGWLRWFFGWRVWGLFRVLFFWRWLRLPRGGRKMEGEERSRTKLDIEVAVRDGMVDVGVFGYLTQEELEGMIQEILEGVKIEG